MLTVMNELTAFSLSKDALSMQAHYSKKKTTTPPKSISSQSKTEQCIHLYPLSSTFSQVAINNSLDTLESVLVRLGENNNAIPSVRILLVRLCFVLRLLRVEQHCEIQKLIV